MSVDSRLAPDLLLYMQIETTVCSVHSTEASSNQELDLKSIQSLSTSDVESLSCEGGQSLEEARSEALLKGSTTSYSMFIANLVQRVKAFRGSREDEMLLTVCLMGHHFSGDPQASAERCRKEAKALCSKGLMASALIDMAKHVTLFYKKKRQKILSFGRMIMRCIGLGELFKHAKGLINYFRSSEEDQTRKVRTMDFLKGTSTKHEAVYEQPPDPLRWRLMRGEMERAKMGLKSVRMGSWNSTSTASSSLERSSTRLSPLLR